MADKTSISWTNATWNPVTGCTKVSSACKHCFAERDWTRLAHLPAYAGRSFTDVACHPERLDQPLRWKRPRMIFVNSMSDVFHEDVPDEFIDQIFAVMALCKQHTFQVLTKRPERMLAYLTRLGKSAKLLDAAARTLGYTFEFQGIYLVSWPIPNVWLGVSVEDQETADARIPLLLASPAAVRWISAEPLLGSINIEKYLLSTYDKASHDVQMLPGLTRDDKLDWIVCGGESGARSRPMHLDWARSLRDQCDEFSTPFFFKQTGIWQMLEGGEAGKNIYRNKVVRWNPDLKASFLKTKGGGSDLLDGQKIQEWPRSAA